MIDMTELHAVLVHLVGPGIRFDDLIRLQERLEDIVRRTATGVCDGNEYALDGSDARVYLYGRSAEGLHAAIASVVESEPVCRGAQVEVRAGPMGFPSRMFPANGK